MEEDLRKRLEATIYEIEFLLHTRSVVDSPESPIHYLYLMEMARHKNQQNNFFIEKIFKTFYGIVGDEIVQLYEVDSPNDFFRFEFIKRLSMTFS